MDKNYVYPENWVEPDPIEKPELTSLQREAFKNLMKTYINNQNRPIEIKDLVAVARDYVYDNYGIVLSDRIIKDVAREIQEEWHPTVVEE